MKHNQSGVVKDVYKNMKEFTFFFFFTFNYVAGHISPPESHIYKVTFRQIKNPLDKRVIISSAEPFANGFYF